jgi:hypothetical protein
MEVEAGVKDKSSLLFRVGVRFGNLEVLSQEERKSFH